MNLPLDRPFGEIMFGRLNAVLGFGKCQKEHFF